MSLTHEEIVAADLAQKLGKLGYQISGATGRGEEAVILARDRPLDLILMDIHLAGRMDGVEAAEIIRRECDVPVIYLAAHSDRATLRRAKLTEPFGFILKPFEELELETHIEMALYKHQAERKLRENEARLASLIHSAMDAIVAVDAEQRIVLFNPAAEKMFGCPAGDARGSSLDRFIPMRFRETHRRHIAEFGRTGATSRGMGALGALKGLRTSGEEFPIEASISQTEVGGHKLFTVIVRDRTELERIERDRLILSKLESTGVMAGGIAHDFNNLLTAILLNLDLAQGLIPAGEELAPFLEEAGKAVLMARGLTQQLITFATGGAPVPKPTRVQEVIQEAVRPALSGSRVRCDFRLPEDLWLAEVDEGQIGQVIRNVVLNAREAMPEGGVVSVRAENRVLAAHEKPSLPPGDYVRVSVADRGGGIAPEVLPKIFDPYFSTKQRGDQKGMGLGLTICHTIIQKHGGAITVESEAGVGTTFHLYLPASRQEIQKEKLRVPEIPSSHARILVMDDEEGVRSVVGAALERMGHEVELVEDGERAVEAYGSAKGQRRPFDAIILDLTVRAGVGGQEAMLELLKMDPDVKAIVMSGYAQDRVVLEPERYGFKGVLAKPFEIRKLREILSRVLGAGGR